MTHDLRDDDDDDDAFPGPLEDDYAAGCLKPILIEMAMVSN